MTILFKNNASATLSVQAEIAHTTLTLQTNEGDLFPAPGAGEFFYVTLEDTSGNIEICRCTGNSADVLTVTRAQENTTAKIFPTGSKVEQRTTAATFDEFVQVSGDAMSGDLDMNGNNVVDPVLTSTGAAAIKGVPMQGADGGTANQLQVPSAGGAPTIGSGTIWHSANDGASSGLDADLLDGQQGSYYATDANAASASYLTTGTVANARLDATVALHNQKNVWTAGEYTAEDTNAATATFDIDADVSNAHHITMGANITTLTLSNMDSGQSIVVLFEQDGVGSKTCAFPAAWVWKNGSVPTLSTAPNSLDVLTLVQFTVSATPTVFASLTKAFS